VTASKTGQRFFVRWHMSLIMAGVVLSGVGVSRALLALGLRSLPLRWLLVLSFGYLVFFVLVRLWMAYAASWWPAEAESAARERGRRGSLFDYVIDGWGPSSADGLGEAIVLLVLGLVLMLLFGLAAWAIVEAPVLLGEAALQALLASGLLPATRRLEARGWVGGLFRATAVPLAVIAVVTVTTGWLIQWRCPEAVRVADVFTRCRQ
jgi:hypothetical protein